MTRIEPPGQAIACRAGPQATFIAPRFRCAGQKGTPGLQITPLQMCSLDVHTLQKQSHLPTIRMQFSHCLATEPIVCIALCSWYPVQAGLKPTLCGVCMPINHQPSWPACRSQYRKRLMPGFCITANVHADVPHAPRARRDIPSLIAWDSYIKGTPSTPSPGPSASLHTPVTAIDLN